MPTGDTIGDPVETKTYRVDALFDDAIGNWNEYIKKCDDYVNREQNTLLRAHYKTLLFRAYGTVLAELIEAFSFHKKPSADFQRRNPTDVLRHISFDRYYDIGSYILRNTTGARVERRGSLEYLAAALVDPEFLELSRIRAGLHDVTQSRSWYYNGGLRGFFEKYCLGENNRRPIYQSGDFFRGAKFDISNHIHRNDSRKRGVPRRIIGAELRLIGEQSERYNNLMNDFVKRHEIIAISDYFWDQCTTVDKTISFEKGKADSIWNYNRAHTEAAELFALRQHAYLKLLGRQTIEVIDNDVLTAVEKNLKPSRYADDHRLAPAFETVSDKDDDTSLSSKELEQDLDTMIFELHHAIKRSTELKRPSKDYKISEEAEIRYGQRLFKKARAVGQRTAEAALIAKQSGKPMSTQTPVPA